MIWGLRGSLLRVQGVHRQVPMARTTHIGGKKKFSNIAELSSHALMCDGAHKMVTVFSFQGGVGGK